MSYINLDVRSIRNSIKSTEDLVEDLNKDLENISLTYDDVKNFWEDNLMHDFVNTVKDDSISFTELFSSMNTHIKSCTNFCNGLESTVKKYLTISSLYNLKYSSTSLENALNYLDLAESKVDSALRKLSLLSVPSSSSNGGAISNLSSNLDTAQIKSLKSTIQSMAKAIDDLIRSSRDESYTHRKYELDNKVMQWISPAVGSPDVQRVTRFKEDEYWSRNKILQVDIDDFAINNSNMTGSYTTNINNSNEELAIKDNGDVKDNTDFNVNHGPSDDISMIESDSIMPYEQYNESKSDSNPDFVDVVHRDEKEIYGSGTPDITVDLAESRDKDSDIYTPSGSPAKGGTVQLKKDDKIEVNKSYAPSTDTSTVIFESGAEQHEEHTYSPSASESLLNLKESDTSEVGNKYYNGMSDVSDVSMKSLDSQVDKY